MKKTLLIVFLVFIAITQANGLTHLSNYIPNYGDRDYVEYTKVPSSIQDYQSDKKIIVIGIISDDFNKIDPNFGPTVLKKVEEKEKQVLDSICVVDFGNALKINDQFREFVYENYRLGETLQHLQESLVQDFKKKVLIIAEIIAYRHKYDLVIWANSLEYIVNNNNGIEVVTVDITPLIRQEMGNY